MVKIISPVLLEKIIQSAWRSECARVRESPLRWLPWFS